MSDYSGERLKLTAAHRRALIDAARACADGLDQLPDYYAPRIVEGWQIPIGERVVHAPDWAGIRTAIIGWHLIGPTCSLLGAHVDRHPLARLAAACAHDATGRDHPDVAHHIAAQVVDRSIDPSWALMWLTEDALQLVDRATMSVMGIGYTPRTICDYQLRAAAAGLKRGGMADSLDDPRVVIVDPALGTGTYLVRALEADAQQIADSQVARVYGDRECHPAMIGCELMPWTHMLGELRIEHAYRQRTNRLDDPSDLRWRGAYLGDTLRSTTVTLPCGHTIFQAATHDPADEQLIS